MIRFEAFSKSYGKHEIIAHSDFSIEPNRISFLMGPNGSGKTTLIKCLTDLEQYQGKISFAGKSYSCIRQACLVVWDDCPFYNKLSGTANLEILSEGRADRLTIDRIASGYLEREILKAKVRTYSYGQRKKLALALAEVIKPEILVMDEISNGLDYESRIRVRHELKTLSRSSTIILTGHQFSFYDGLVDDVFVFQDRQIVKYNPADNQPAKLEEIYHDEIYHPGAEASFESQNNHPAHGNTKHPHDRGAAAG